MWPVVDEDASRTIKSADDEGQASAAPVHVTFTDGPLGVKWSIPPSSEIPFR